jgi:hypothetical protein
MNGAFPPVSHSDCNMLFDNDLDRLWIFAPMKHSLPKMSDNDLDRLQIFAPMKHSLH